MELLTQGKDYISALSPGEKQPHLKAAGDGASPPRMDNKTGRMDLLPSTTQSLGLGEKLTVYQQTEQMLQKVSIPTP